MLDFGTSGRRCSLSSLGGRLATALVDCYFHHHFFPVNFSHRGSAQIKKLSYLKLTGAPKNLGVYHFQDPIGHFEAPSVVAILDF